MSHKERIYVVRRMAEQRLEAREKASKVKP